MAIVAGHGQFADGVVSAVEQISGRGAAFATLSNTGLAPADIERALLAQLDGTGARVVFTDLPAGSCTMAARRVQRARPDVVLVTGANVSALLEFLFATVGLGRPADEERVDVGVLAQAAAAKGRETLVAITGAAS
jgi:PTS system N-acetylgalactosamine-specific IIA component